MALRQRSCSSPCKEGLALRAIHSRLKSRFVGFQELISDFAIDQGKLFPLFEGVGEPLQFSGSPGASGFIESGFVEVDHTGAGLLFLFTYQDVAGVQVGVTSTAAMELSQRLAHGPSHSVLWEFASRARRPM